MTKSCRISVSPSPSPCYRSVCLCVKNCLSVQMLLLVYLLEVLLRTRHQRTETTEWLRFCLVDFSPPSGDDENLTTENSHLEKRLQALQQGIVHVQGIPCRALCYVLQVLCQPRPPPTTNSLGSGASGTLTPSRTTPSRSNSSNNKQIKRLESEGLALIVAAGFLYDTPCNRSVLFLCRRMLVNTKKQQNVSRVGKVNLRKDYKDLGPKCKDFIRNRKFKCIFSPSWFQLHQAHDGRRLRGSVVRVFWRRSGVRRLRGMWRLWWLRRLRSVRRMRRVRGLWGLWWVTGEGGHGVEAGGGDAQTEHLQESQNMPVS